MDKIISNDYEINKTVYSKEEAIKIFESVGLNEKAELIKYKDGDTVKYINVITILIIFMDILCLQLDI